MKNNPSTEWKQVAEIPGALQAELLRGLLEAQGVQVRLSQEGAGRAYGLSVGPLGVVRLYVPASQESLAQEVLDAYERGDLDPADDRD